MSDVTVSPVVQSMSVSPTTQSVTVSVPFASTVNSLTDLSDVTVAAAGSGYILRHDGTEFKSVLGTGYFSAVGHQHTASDVTGLVSFQNAVNASLLDHSDRLDGIDSTLAGYPTFGTAAALDFNVAGNATATQVVRGGDTRLTDARTPTSHVHSYADITSGYPALSYASAQRVTTQTLSTSSWTSLGSVSLAAGTWFVTSTVTVQHSSATASTAIKIASSTTNYAATEGRTPASNVNLSLSCSAIITLTGTTSIDHYGICSATTTTVQYLTSLPSGNTVGGSTYLAAVRIA